ncbi:MAG: hypothetical protein HYZ37_11430 [Candidatus Solibacter usitatus]|nr:hypothetical protein [Candidatus Solibacter usitatus]
MRYLLAICAVSISAFAADVSGEWKATAEGPNGSMQRTFSLKAEGSKLTGETVSSMMGKSTINDGKIDGDNLSFTIVVKFQDNEAKLNYKGKVLSKDEIKFTVDGIQGGQTIEWVAKRVK